MSQGAGTPISLRLRSSLAPSVRPGQVTGRGAPDLVAPRPGSGSHLTHGRHGTQRLSAPFCIGQHWATARYLFLRARFGKRGQTYGARVVCRLSLASGQAAYRRRTGGHSVVRCARTATGAVAAKVHSGDQPHGIFVAIQPLLISPIPTNTITNSPIYAAAGLRPRRRYLPLAFRLRLTELQAQRSESGLPRGVT